MQAAPQSSGFRLFSLFGIDVFIHWTWLVGAYFIYMVSPQGNDPLFFAVTYLSLFGIVLLHEFGHALACRSVGGQANRIVLFILGGVAYVKPPPRPGAVLWSIAAGPLVNVVLLPITLGAYLISTGGTIMPEQHTFLQHYLGFIALTNLVLLIFNMLPIYPLDGGQILQSLLWFIVGRAKSLRIVSILGLIAAAGLAILFLMIDSQRIFTYLMIAYIAWKAWEGLKIANYLSIIESQERQQEQRIRDQFS